MTQTTSDQRRDAVLAKIRKLLAKAEDPAASTDEAETYTAKATALIASWGIDAALLAADDPASDPVGDRVLDLEAPYAADKADLLAAVALRLRCQVVVRTRRGAGTRDRSVHLFGHRSDLERSELLFTSLLVQSHHALARTPVPPWEHAAAFRRSWLAGFTAAVARRLAAAERAAEQAAGTAEGTDDHAGRRSTALVLADRAEVVREAVASAYPDARAARPRQLSGGGAADGWAAGQRADLGGTRLAGRRGLPPGA
jgi:hypothetical protein